MEKIVQEIKNDGDLKGCLLVIVGVAVSLAPYIVIAQGVLVPASTITSIAYASHFLMGSGIGIIIGHIAFNLLRGANAFFNRKSALPDIPTRTQNSPSENSAPQKIV